MVDQMEAALVEDQAFHAESGAIVRPHADLKITSALLNCLTISFAKAPAENVPMLAFALRVVIDLH